MKHVIFLVLRRLRTPLIVLVCVYAIAVLGFVLIPGMDDNGQPWEMGFFHAFYFVSFMGSTIGFGEIPYPFTDAQRLWTLFTIYASVVSWLYAIGTLITLLQTSMFQEAVTRNGFIRQVKNIDRKFYIVCGYGDTGRKIAHALISENIRCVVIDKNSDRINELDLEDVIIEIPHLNADAGNSDVLNWAGITNPHCRGVIAVTKDDEVNLKVAIASKLLNPNIPVYCWAEHQDTAKNMASFGTDHIVNPYQIFADFFSTALVSPNRYLLGKWLTSPGTSPKATPVRPPKGRWLLCGFGRFGKAVYEKLLHHGLPVSVIELNPDATSPPSGTIYARGTEAETLEQAEINKSVGIIAGTDHDVNNLSILLTARELKPDIFTIARQQYSSNQQMFSAANLDLVTSNSSLIASRILATIMTPMTMYFIQRAEQESDEWIDSLVDRLDTTSDANPSTWVNTISYEKSRAFIDRFNQGEDIRLEHLKCEPGNADTVMPCLALMIQRDGKEILLPDDNTLIYPHDKILFAGAESMKSKVQALLESPQYLHLAITGEHLPSGFLWKWLTARFPKISSN